MNRFGFTFRRIFFVASAYVLVGCTAIDPVPTPTAKLSLSDLSVESLRGRDYTSKLKLAEPLGAKCALIAKRADDRSAYTSYMAAYDSDGLNMYARIDLPADPAPSDGFPVIVFAHGWVGIDDAPNYHFGCKETSIYAAAIDTYARAGFVVLSPGYRGHGTVGGIAADGIEYMRDWDNGSYLSPVFYAVDVLNLMAAIPSLKNLSGAEVEIDASRLYLSGHSQGGDVALQVLSATGEDAVTDIEITAASIWAGNIADRFSQLETFYPMQKTPQAFLSGDGAWTGTAKGKNGEFNTSFVFGFPPDWIETTKPDEWTWQTDSWSTPSVKVALEEKYGQMYNIINQQIAGIEDAKFNIEENTHGLEVTHDSRVKAGMEEIGGFRKPEYLSEPLNLHFSDRDFYSLPLWNLDLCARIRDHGGRCETFEYAGNTHSFKASEHRWFSPPGTEPGYDTILLRDLILFAAP